MASITWTRDALDDVDAIGRYIGATASPAASVFIQTIFDAVERLQVFPNSGRVVPELGRDDVRELIVGNYRVMYLLGENDRVWILAIRHGARSI